MRTLRNAVEQGKVHHAYLFVGSRGTGKTSMAKILAACLNCRDARRATARRRAVRRLRLLRLDRQRDLARRDRDGRGVQQLGRRHPRPARARRLRAGRPGGTRSTSSTRRTCSRPQAWNAFLKTLEEPPPNTIFVLATTEANKVLPTVVDRCHRFDFARPTRRADRRRAARVADARADRDRPRRGRAARPPRDRLVPRRARDARAARHLLAARAIARRATCSPCSASPTRTCCSARSTPSPPATPREALLAVAAPGRVRPRRRRRFVRDLEAHARELLVVQTLGEVPAAARDDRRARRAAGRAGRARSPARDVVRAARPARRRAGGGEGRRRRAHAARARARQGRRAGGRRRRRARCWRASSGSRRTLGAARAPTAAPPRRRRRRSSRRRRRAAGDSAARGRSAPAAPAAPPRHRPPPGRSRAEPEPRPPADADRAAGPTRARPRGAARRLAGRARRAARRATWCSAALLAAAGPSRSTAASSIVAFAQTDAFKRRKAEDAQQRERVAEAVRTLVRRAARGCAPSCASTTTSPMRRAAGAARLRGGAGRRASRTEFDAEEIEPDDHRGAPSPDAPAAQHAADAQAGPEDAGRHDGGAGALKDESVEASAGGGMVTVEGHRRPRLKELTIDPDAVDPEDVEMLQDMVLAAVNEALARRAGARASRRSWAASTGGLGGLGGLGLPGLLAPRACTPCTPLPSSG